MQTVPESKPRYFVWRRGPYYYEIRDRVTGSYVDIVVGDGAEPMAQQEAARRNIEDGAA